MADRAGWASHGIDEGSRLVTGIRCHAVATFGPDGFASFAGCATAEAIHAGITYCDVLTVGALQYVAGFLEFLT